MPATVYDTANAVAERARVLGPIHEQIEAEKAALAELSAARDRAHSRAGTDRVALNRAEHRYVVSAGPHLSRMVELVMQRETLAVCLPSLGGVA
jgi:hypothetical protein